ncbi:flagellar basal body-associated protein FliL [Motilimonas eburnea]|uniref:flagellar basal body-associated protein FliL n=1 Tax=Motilimonas eburnea TaxID=1737488 RepID=UPI001E61CCD4|nr:flagellar basal body-associated protein FliL [Motilimonas eburnea]MCE2572387.1 flagellar basal body-associated protein FliL [Motilimonas eburnea]
MKKGLLCLFLLLFISAPSLAEEEKAGGIAYYAFEPDIITNYIKPGKRIGYVRVAVEFQLASASDLAVIEHHDPLLRDAMIEIFGRQDEQKIKSLTGREEIRDACLQQVNKLLVQEAGIKGVSNVIFTKYMYQ